jgi:hypothetical protein
MTKRTFSLKIILTACLGALALGQGVSAQNFPGWDAAPAAAPQAGAADQVQALQGAWFSTNGKETMLIIFQGNTVGFAVNQNPVYGTWSAQGDRLKLSFQNGKSLEFQFAVQGDTLILNGALRLTRQQIPQQGVAPQPASPYPAPAPAPQPASPYPAPAPAPAPAPQPSSPYPAPAPQPGAAPYPGQQPYPGATPAPAPQPNPGQYPQPGAAASPLEGSWQCGSPNGPMTFTFTGSMYTFAFNGQVIETGSFSLSGNTLSYRVLSGPNAGNSGQNQVVLQGGNVMIMTLPNGMSFNYVRTGSVPQAYPQSGQFPQAAPMSIEGRWVAVASSRKAFIVSHFNNGRYVSYFNGRELERGRYTASNGQLILLMDNGESSGMRLEWGYHFQNGMLVLTIPGRQPTYWRRG